VPSCTLPSPSLLLTAVLCALHRVPAFTPSGGTHPSSWTHFCVRYKIPQSPSSTPPWTSVNLRPTLVPRSPHSTRQQRHRGALWGRAKTLVSSSPPAPLSFLSLLTQPCVAHLTVRSPTDVSGTYSNCRSTCRVTFPPSLFPALNPQFSSVRLLLCVW